METTRCEPRPRGHRRFYCVRCRQVLVVCLRCDRGQRYCGAGCRSEARRESLRQAGCRYQKTLRGRRANAERQRRFRQRRERNARKVTHQGPKRTAPRSDAAQIPTLKPGGDAESVSTAHIIADRRAVKMSNTGAEPKCHCCGLPCGLYTRFHFLIPRSSRRKPRLPRD